MKATSAATAFWVSLLADVPTNEPANKDLARWVAEGPGWTDDVGNAVNALRPGDRLVLFLEGQPPRRIGQALRNSRSFRGEVRTPEGLAEVILRHGGRVEAVFTLWPTASSARLAVPRDASGAMHWAVRTGIVGGGRRPWVRWLLRSRLAALVTPRLATSGAVVCGRAEVRQ